VSAVHDGDTLSLDTGNGAEHIRLQGLDAPELAQAYGSTARQALSQRTLQQSVRVAYEQRDAYNRILGQVFTSSCQDVNLQLLQTGMAWFYKAYACELDSSRRVQYAQAESQARAQHLGLWSQNQPQAPWVYRNGEDPPMPLCAN
jgi:endonuclease YncB( thermonuclease family)